MKPITKWMTAILFVSLFYGCGPSAEDVLKKYESYLPIESDTEINKVGISASVMSQMGAVFIDFSNPELNTNEEYLNAMANRLYVADAEKPNEPLPVRTGSSTHTVTYVNGEKTVTEGLSILLDKEVKALFLVVGFKGIDKSESESLHTPPLFFLIDRKAGRILTPVPLLAGNLFAADYEKTHFYVLQATLTNRNNSPVNLSEKTYTIRIGEIGKSEEGNTYVDFLSEDVKEDDWKEEYTFLGTKFRIEPIGLYSNVTSPLLTQITAGGKTILAKGFIVEEGKGIRIFYATDEMPDTIIVWANDMVNLTTFRLGEKIVFDGKTKAVIKEYRYAVPD